MSSQVNHPKWPWITLLVLQVLQLLSLVPWLPMVGLSFMAFDAPGSDKMWQPWAFVALICSYQLWLLGAGVLSWVLFALSALRLGYSGLRPPHATGAGNPARARSECDGVSS